ncbi:ABC transporter permease [Phormidium pseudopriestleyi FRX01]|uniref:ABC transporter permease n=1 Tax=Phormidium pseudopriestleyi FRX01 TaxID=1759528 RepID=A0ABS3FWH6_9CYAN|nr:ABC transporter permease [Phormidium pseudopriestleyi]MBO0351480.1 ABC transporter permease [Phormidium pseudopriestleyi FRX01]
MVPVAWRMIWEAKGRFAIAVLGIAFSVMLMLFLLGVYQGVKFGSKSYVLHTQAEVWVSQRNTRNLIKTSSFLPETLGNSLRQVEGVKSVDGLLRTIAPAEFPDKTITLYIFGFDSESQIGAPEISSGTSNLQPQEIILDRAFTATHNLKLGDSLSLQGYPFKIVGISRGTNLIVGQFAFTRLDEIPRLLGLRNVRSFFLLNLDSDSPEIISRLEAKFPDLVFIPKQQFAENNVEEMEIGILPILWTIVSFGAITGGTVIVLMMYTSVLEKREDYAMLKAVGASQNFLITLVLKQSMLAALLGFSLGLIVDITFAPLLAEVIPSLLFVFTWQDAAGILVGCLILGAIGTLAPIRTLKNIYPAEVFRA